MDPPEMMVRSAHRRLLPIGLLFTIGHVLTPAQAAAMPWVCAETFTLGRADRVFDATHIDVVLFKSSSLVLATDTFGAWTPTEGTGPADSLQLRHRVLPQTSLSLCVLAPSQIPTSKVSWERLCQNAAESAPDPTRVAEILDSGSDAEVFPVIGWPTREVALTETGLMDGVVRQVRHIVAIGPRATFVLTLSAPEEFAARALDDLRFFVARLEQLKD